ncbi:RNA-guided endonuclease InsQ/TnpB family protein [Escherichia coli]|uniref:Transposase n=2 Tax=Gammaproteobacteria TaxID=1236 RepID=A0A8S7K103_ECOLX|nr:RNA-guided endonuclease TnpB family protein [Escherichia coli]EFN7270128.1 transposase [Escherichia coli O21]EFB2662850.1 IS200/IS605 family element transposase accessory protein TnpB [Escherichia coli]EFC9752691.1 transposase [Escherichia coli]EFF9567416.1 IS200/IS605 family element transposase accessory protein TnpB [Escherichia coli]EFH9271925.1 IS200/IS605 family element transposase accessory protein TnpB [Escherichia coli]
MLRATKVRIYPTTEQAEYLNAQFGAVRFAYNKALHIKKHAYQRYGVNLSPRKDLKPLLSIAKKSRKYAWLKEFDSMALQQAVINLDAAFSNFFNPKLKARFPTFKRKHGRQSSYHCTGIKVLDDAIKIPKLNLPIKARIHRVITGKVTSITITRNAAGEYHASILCDDGIPAPEKPTYLEEEKITGVDMGLTDYAIKSDGNKVGNPRHLINASRNLRRKQKALSRKQKGSANRKKARIRLAALHERVANARADFQHKLSRAIVDENQAVIVETLKTANMMKNHNLARAIGDAGWHSFITKLEYKAAEKGVHLVKLDQWFASSKTCHCCGYKMPEMPLHKRIWRCPECGAEHDRDINAALNIRQKGILELKAAGLVVSVHGGQRKSVEQTVAA